ncbi:MAG: SWIM zinc finger family protein [Saprospiraceae bacterium]
MPQFIMDQLSPDDWLVELVPQLTDNYLRELFGKTVFRRGREYYTHHKIGLQEIVQGKLLANAYGVSGRYNLELNRTKSELSGHCDCPSSDACKHLAALLLLLREEATKEELGRFDHQPRGKKKEKKGSSDSQLAKLSKSQLIELVKRYAPAGADLGAV